MTDHLSEEDTLAAVPGLTRARLSTFIETSAVMRPLHPFDAFDSVNRTTGA